MPAARSSTRRTTARQNHPVDDLKSFHANGGKRYSSLNPATVDAMPFEIEVYRNGLPEVHGFIARPVMDFGSVLLMLKGNEADTGQALLRIMRMNLDDADGVSDAWQPTMLDKPTNAAGDWQPKFRAPAAPHGDGRLHPMADMGRWTDPQAGSSRRRWSHLMFEDDGVVVTMTVVFDILKDLTERAAGIPTDGS
jgi:hypothetical protein